METEDRRVAAVSQALLTLAAVVVIIAGIKAATAIVIPVLLAVFIAILCGPPLAWLGRKGVSKGLALLLIITGVVIAGGGVAALLSTSIQDFSQDLPQYEAKLTEHVDAGIAWLQARGVDTSGIEVKKLFDAGAVMRYTALLLNGLSGALANGFVVLMIVIFILLEATSMPAKLAAAARSGEEALGGLQAMLESVNRYMAIKTLVSLGTGVLVALLLLSLGVKYPLLWGLLAFLFNYIPNIGSILAAVPPVLLAFIQLGALPALGTAVGFIVINLVVGNVVEPRLMGKGLGLSTLVVFLSLLFWGWVLGPVGMLLSVPLTIVLKIAMDTRQETRWLSVLLGR